MLELNIRRIIISQVQGSKDYVMSCRNRSNQKMNNIFMLDTELYYAIFGLNYSSVQEININCKQSTAFQTNVFI